MKLLIVGGGQIGVEKLQAVAANAPNTSITIVAKEMSADIKKIAEQFSSIQLIEKSYDINDLENIDIVIAAVNDRTVSEQVVMDANTKGILVNAADKPDLCDFYLGSIVQKGNLKIAISTNGKSPTLAKRLKEVLQQNIPDALDDSLHQLNKLRNNLRGNFSDKVKKLNDITKVLIENEQIEKESRWRKIAGYSVLIFAIMLLGHFLFSFLPLNALKDSVVNLYTSLDDKFPIMLLAGFIAQLIDGALGMGYGVTSATVLLSAGVNPAAISGSIHTAEMFASGASGYSHYKFGNVNKKLFKALLIPGIIGAIGGAILLVYLGEKHANYVRPILAIYTLLLGVRILLNAFRRNKQPKKFKYYSSLAGLGGFLDSFGGGGWGPLVTTTLITKGRSPRYVIGTVSLTEFFVTLSSAFTFFILLGVTHWQTILGLIIGGLLAAPIAAKLAGKLPRKTAFVLLGCLVIWWSIRILWKLF